MDNAITDSPCSAICGYIFYRGFPRLSSSGHLISVQGNGRIGNLVGLEQSCPWINAIIITRNFRGTRIGSPLFLPTVATGKYGTLS
ncbi:hypothetical protein HHX47_DHR7000399 [Lentinula edodes]|nr:hypothetical protein HHX47_DHR7000399 [Lentinula edodes]